MKWEPVDWVILGLVIGVSVTLFMPLLGMAIHAEGFNPERAKAIGRLLDGILAIVSMYVGARIGRMGK